MTYCETARISVRNDIDLVEMARAGKRDAFDELTNRHYSRCMAVACLILRDREEAQDQVQNAFCKAFKHLVQFQGSAEFSSWLSRIVENECLMYFRSQGRAKFVYLDNLMDADRPSIDLPARSLDPEHELVIHELASAVRQEMKQLPPLLRAAIVLRDIEELPMAEVAHRLGVSVPAAKSRLLRARFELRARAMKHCGKLGFYMSASVVQFPPTRPVSTVTRCA